MSNPDRAADSPSSRPSGSSGAPAGPTESSGAPAGPTESSGAPAAGSVAPGTEVAPLAGDENFETTLAELTSDDLPVRRRRQLLGRLVGQIRQRGVKDLFKPTAAVRWLVNSVAAIAPHVPIRDLPTLRLHHPGLDDEELAERLIRNAARVSAGIGAAGGGVSAVQWAATPTLLSAPVLLAAETVAVVAVELKLVGELHQVYGIPVPGTGTERAINMIHAWSNQRGVNPVVPGVGVGAVLGTAARRELGELLMRRLGRNLTTLGPFLTGAAVASYLNRRATRALADRVRDDLRAQRRALGLMHPEPPPRRIGP
ncbi:hypothetical protein O7632_23320 [Solwaraspora sp. WMMD406]|uniref:hypothetical protein n=1 Tax=Solwaraspora sp. WMMD406 TaxID=3016095 RepID=UPI0024161BF0|nr:hypothetical protein [Solwaraspora sp. WMMD406]MDG4767004.1 hypothetical protein [Solwaraspora sp. WMMD406]